MFLSIMRERKKKLMGLTVTSSLKLQNELTQKEPKKNLAGSKARKNKDIKFDIYTGSCKEKLQYVTEN